MSEDFLTPEARRENAIALAAAAGLDSETAGKQLNFTVQLTHETSDQATHIGGELYELFRRTVQRVARDEIDADPAVEIVIGQVQRRTNAPVVYVSLDEQQAVIGTESQPEFVGADPTTPRLLLLIVACYTAGFALNRVLSQYLPFSVPDPLTIRFDELTSDVASLNRAVDIGPCYLAGAGAIGNGFLWAARHIDLCGELVVIDDDEVSSGNLNRQIWFERADIGAPKAQRLVELAQPHFANLVLTHRRCRLQDVPEKSSKAWLSRLIVAVDSRRARRQLQNEFPREVFDASTTDIREIVIHHNIQPNQYACLSCIYESDAAEHSREAHIAEHLGVSIADVRTERISAEVALQIVTQFPKLDALALNGMAYDSLFKQLCSEQQLGTIDGGSAVTAPFAFVSVLAGALLTLDIVEKLVANDAHFFNYWRASPWHAPLRRRKILRSKQPRCVFCGDAVLSKVNEALWHQ